MANPATPQVSWCLQTTPRVQWAGSRCRLQYPAYLAVTGKRIDTLLSIYGLPSTFKFRASINSFHWSRTFYGLPDVPGTGDDYTLKEMWPLPRLPTDVNPSLHYSSFGPHRKQRRNRTNYSAAQLNELEMVFQRTRYVADKSTDIFLFFLVFWTNLFQGFRTIIADFIIQKAVLWYPYHTRTIPDFFPLDKRDKSLRSETPRLLVCSMIHCSL